MVGVGIGVALLFAFGRMNRMWSLSADERTLIDDPADAVIAIDRTEWDLGKVYSGRVADATFEIRNVGRSRLILRKTNGDCDCLSTGEAEIIVPPGGCRKVVARLDTSKTLGPVSVGVHYQTNDPQRRRLSLFCLADVVSP